MDRSARWPSHYNLPSLVRSKQKLAGPNWEFGRPVDCGDTLDERRLEGLVCACFSIGCGIRHRQIDSAQPRIRKKVRAAGIF